MLPRTTVAPTSLKHGPLSGFEAFFPGAKKAGETMAKEQAKRGGNGGKKPGGGEEPPQTSLATLGALGLGAFLLMNMFNESQGGGREINWQEFKYQLLEQGLVSFLPATVTLLHTHAPRPRQWYGVVLTDFAWNRLNASS